MHAQLHFHASTASDAPPAKVTLTQFQLPDFPKGKDSEKLHVKWKHVLTIERPSRAVFNEQIKQVVAHARNDGRRHRAPEILTQVLPQVPYWNSVVPLSPWRNRHTFELIGIALHFAMQVCHNIKHAFAVPRPNELSVHVQPILQTPGWSAFPSGHATEAFMFARLMRGLLHQSTDSGVHTALQKQAKSIADNRVFAGLHYPVDSVAGQVLGETLAEYVISLCTEGTNAQKWRPRTFKSHTDELKGIDFEPLEATMDENQGHWLVVDPATRGAHSEVLKYLWDKARTEWNDVGFEAET